MLCSLYNISKKVSYMRLIVFYSSYPIISCHRWSWSWRLCTSALVRSLVSTTCAFLTWAWRLLSILFLNIIGSTWWSNEWLLNSVVSSMFIIILIAENVIKMLSKLKHAQNILFVFILRWFPHILILISVTIIRFNYLVNHLFITSFNWLILFFTLLFAPRIAFISLFLFPFLTAWLFHIYIKHFFIFHNYLFSWLLFFNLYRLWLWCWSALGFWLGFHFWLAIRGLSLLTGWFEILLFAWWYSWFEWMWQMSRWFQFIFNYFIATTLALRVFICLFLCFLLLLVAEAFTAFNFSHLWCLLRFHRFFCLLIFPSTLWALFRWLGLFWFCRFGSLFGFIFFQVWRWHTFNWIRSTDAFLILGFLARYFFLLLWLWCRLLFRQFRTLWFFGFFFSFFTLWYTRFSFLQSGRFRLFIILIWFPRSLTHSRLSLLHRATFVLFTFSGWLSFTLFSLLFTSLGWIGSLKLLLIFASH